MQILSCPQFAVVGSYSLPPGTKAFAIHSASEVDVCTVGGHLVGVGQLVPASDGVVRAVRGFRTGILNQGDSPDNQTPPPIGQTLVLVAYDAHDALVPPTARAPVQVSAVLPGASLGADVAHANCILRLPFSGRKQGVFYIRRNDAALDGNPVNVVIRGVRYLSREQIAALGGGAQPFLDEITDQWTSKLSTVNKQNNGAVNELLGLTSYVGGGGDRQEFYDEIELWVWGIAGANPIVAIGEASGERNL